MEEIVREICSATHKVCYSRKDAGEIVNRSKRSKHHKRKDIPLRVYYCKQCGAYHTTHFKKRSRNGYKRVSEKSTHIR